MTPEHLRLLAILGRSAVPLTTREIYEAEGYEWDTYGRSEAMRIAALCRQLCKQGFVLSTWRRQFELSEYSITPDGIAALLDKDN